MKSSIIYSVAAVNLIITFFSDRVSCQSITGLEHCISKKKVTGCTIPFNSSFPYKAVFKPACNRHEICYHCGNRFDWSRNDCDVGFLYDMYYACAIKDIERRRKRVQRSVNESEQKSINSEKKAMESKESNADGKIEIDKEIAEKIRKTAARLIQHDTAAIVEDLQEEADMREDTHERDKGHHHLKKEMKKEMKKEVSKKVESETVKEKEQVERNMKKSFNVDHESEKKHHRKMKKIKEKSQMTKKLKGKAKRTENESEDRLMLISSKYHEIEKVLLELKGMIKMEQERLKGMHEVKNDDHVTADKHDHHHKNHGVKASNNSENLPKEKKISKEDEGQNKIENAHRIKNWKKHNHKTNKMPKEESIVNHIEEHKMNEQGPTSRKTAEDKRKRMSQIKDNEANSKGKTFFQRCKLAAYLYFISTRGFGDKFYLKQSPDWCEKGCVKATGGVSFKTLRRPRAII